LRDFPLFFLLNSTVLLKETDYRSLTGFTEETEALFLFLNRTLRPAASFLLQNEYPSVFQSYPGGSSLSLWLDNQPVSHVAFSIREYLHPEFPIKMGLIGSVATQEAYRGRGFATRLLQEAIQKLKNSGCLLALLWADQADFYQPLGFYRAGLELGFSLSPASVLPVSRNARLLEGKSEKEAVWKLNQKHLSKLRRAAEEKERLLDIPEAQIFVSEMAGEIDSYIAINKGKDFSNTIHEWGGAIEAVIENISFCQRNIFSNTSLQLIAPYTSENLGFLKIAEHSSVGSLGLMKLLDKQALYERWMAYGKKKGKSPLENQWHSQTEEQCLIQTLGRDGLNADQALPLFLWGFDSI